MLSPRLPPWLEISDRTLPGASASPGLIRESATDSPEEPPRFPHGFYEAAFYIDGAFDKLAPRAFRDLLFRALKTIRAGRRLSSWIVLPTHLAPWMTRSKRGSARTWTGPMLRPPIPTIGEYARTLAASVRWLEADDAARLRPAYMSVEDVGVRVADNLSVIDPFPLLHLPNPNVPVALADFCLRGFAITRFLAVLLDASIAAGSVRVPWHLPLGVKVLMERVVMFCLVMFGLVLRSRSRG